MENKQTAVEWLKLQLETYGDPQYCELTWKELDELCEQAKEMEKEQIIDDYFQGVCDESDTHGAQSINFKDAENYYNAKYGK